MRRKDLIVFLVVSLLLYGFLNGYIIKRGLQAFSSRSVGRLLFVAVFSFLILSFPLSRIINGQFSHRLSQILAVPGIYYLAFMFYLFLLLFLKDLIRWSCLLFQQPVKTSSWLSVSNTASFTVILSVSLIIIFSGHLNAIRPVVKTLHLQVDKTADSRTGLRAVMLSDIHLGMYNRSNRLEALVRKINELNPEIVFFAGDIVDEAIGAEEEEKMVRLMKDIRAPLGLFACPGNHEYYGGLEKNISYLERAGVQELLDKALKIDGSFYVIGRKDRAALRFGDRRASLPAIMAADQVEPSLPLIVLDHQPIGLEEAERTGLDLLLCGHTHAGQLFPLNIINKLIYEKNWGYLKKGQTHIYVTSGAGTWGPAVRTGSRSEIVLLELSFRRVDDN
ncbi:MAG TPA: metallophosphoesterase [Candidatus Saccharicenans sp.]|nr:metallophosphoesterase [Candidatus Saccharicenans sp.]